MLLVQITQFHKICGFKWQIKRQKSKHNIKCSLCDFVIIINKELMTTDLTFYWLSLPQQWCYTNSRDLYFTPVSFE